MLVPLQEKYNQLKQQQLEVKTFRLKQSQSTVEQNEHHKVQPYIVFLIDGHILFYLLVEVENGWVGQLGYGSKWVAGLGWP